MTLTAVGLDLGNSWTNICVSWPGYPDGLVAKIPSRYTQIKPPGTLNKSGQRGKPNAFPITLTKTAGDFNLWMGQDTLTVSATQKLDAQKYNSGHIQILFRGALAQWELTHKRRGVDLTKLGKLNIVASMPPSLYEQGPAFTRAKRAYSDAFNRNAHSHLMIKRPGLQTVQVVARFGHLTQEAVAFGKEVPRANEWVLVIDLGGGTRDFAIFNGSTEPVRKGSKDNGIMDAYEEIDPNNIALAELEILRNKKNLPAPIMNWYSDVEFGIQRMLRAFRHPISRLYIVGGAAALMPDSVKASLRGLDPQVFIKDEYTTCRANWVAAGGKDE